MPHFVRAIDLQVRLPNPLDIDAQHVVAPGSCASQRRVALLRRVAPVARRRDLHHTADRLDAVGMAVAVDECPHGLKWRPSSAWAKKALARRRISFALRSSRSSRSSVLTRSSSAVVSPGRWPVSRERGAVASARQAPKPELPRDPVRTACAVVSYTTSLSLELGHRWIGGPPTYTFQQNVQPTLAVRERRRLLQFSGSFSVDSVHFNKIVRSTGTTARKYDDGASNSARRSKRR
ncbi:MAG: hypothetical protein JWP72_3067 [Massilia sp.]|nr:hypothetical protein [Massilia sp.]